MTAAGAFAVGGRLHPRVGVYTGITTFAHIRKDMRVDSILGDDLPEPTAAPASFGQLTLFDLLVLRVFVPTKTWVEPYLDLGGSVGAYSKPYKKGHVVAGGGRIGAGVDFWIGPIFSVGLAFDQRFIAIERTLGHTLNAGVTTSVHW